MKRPLNQSKADYWDALETQGVEGYVGGYSNEILSSIEETTSGVLAEELKVFANKTHGRCADFGCGVGM